MQAHPSPSIEAERTTTDSIHISLYLDWSKSGSFFVGKINKHYSKWKQTNKTKVKVAKVTFNNLFFFLSFFLKKSILPFLSNFASAFLTVWIRSTLWALTMFTYFLSMYSFFVAHSIYHMTWLCTHLFQKLMPS